ncbi:GntR family transcriptional regulator [Parafrankia irregularis]|uniref:GntR family transcriptional regulator n=1 Tax=Parafrankia irregularis TaxID=795642 RepID=A0A0S4R0A5_9ACTN|nr:GntR family transcriptional regulator [Parafrankia irregularis]CUU61277.1 GntR family transcriptional regulator [Parafrankia irregularis]
MTQPVAAYIRIKNELRRQIFEGELQPGDLAPSEQKIRDTWNVSRGTAVRALAELRAEGYLTTEPGVGTRVLARGTQGGADRARRLLATGSIFRQDETSTITGAGLQEAPADVAQALGLEPGAQVIRRSRLLTDRDGVAAISVSWLPGEFAEVLPALLQPKSLGGTGTLRAIDEATGRAAVRIRETAIARLASDTEATALGLTTPAAVLETQNLFLDHAGEAIEYGVDVAPGRRARAVEIELS